LRYNSFSVEELSASVPGYRTAARRDTKDPDQSTEQNCDRPYRSSGRDDLDSQVPQPSANNKTMISPETLAKARANGSVRVIVELQLGPHKEESEEARENAIRVAQQALLDELTKVSHRVIRAYTAIPAIVLAASAEALGIIAASPHVTRVTEDELSVPFKQTQPKR
jgi:hypothetical protein